MGGSPLAAASTPPRHPCSALQQEMLKFKGPEDLPKPGVYCKKRGKYACKQRKEHERGKDESKGLRGTVGTICTVLPPHKNGRSHW